MYGTVARMRLKTGMEAKLKEDMAQYERLKIPGFVSTMVYRMDTDPNELYMAVAFKDKASYVANARDPKQDELQEDARSSHGGPRMARRRDHRV